ncbi:MAG: CRISPR-associated endonuclease Cas1 [Anaerolineae bacterium]|nr:MAG: CRISPR-associated endonuclease Cas1 [Anaerolineae bacterium]
MPALYLTEQQTKIRIRNRRLRVERETDSGSTGRPEVLLSVPLHHVEQVVLFGNIGLTTPAIAALLERGCEVVFLTRHGEYRGRLVGAFTPHVPLRRAQYRALEDAEFPLAMAAHFVRAKLLHQKALLLRNSRPARSERVAQAVAILDRALENLPRKRAISSLRGLEGSATAAYFGGLRTFFDPQWRFLGRNRRPPRDPVNVLLSLGYTLLTQVALAAVQTVGLDPYAGFLHEVVYNRPALALDLVEEFRPVVDGLALWLCRSGVLTPQDFLTGTPERPILLSDEGRRRFLRAWEERLETKFTHPVRQQRLPLRQCLIEQARQIARAVQQGKAVYTPMGFR